MLKALVKAAKISLINEQTDNTNIYQSNTLGKETELKNQETDVIPVNYNSERTKYL